MTLEYRRINDLSRDTSVFVEYVHPLCLTRKLKHLQGDPLSGVVPIRSQHATTVQCIWHTNGNRISLSFYETANAIDQEEGEEDFSICLRRLQVMLPGIILPSPKAVEINGSSFLVFGTKDGEACKIFGVFIGYELVEDKKHVRVDELAQVPVPSPMSLVLPLSSVSSGFEVLVASAESELAYVGSVSHGRMEGLRELSAGSQLLALVKGLLFQQKKSVEAFWCLPLQGKAENTVELFSIRNNRYLVQAFGSREGCLRIWSLKEDRCLFQTNPQREIHVKESALKVLPASQEGIVRVFSVSQTASGSAFLSIHEFKFDDEVEEVLSGKLLYQKEIYSEEKIDVNNFVLVHGDGKLNAIFSSGKYASFEYAENDFRDHWSSVQADVTTNGKKGIKHRVIELNNKVYALELDGNSMEGSINLVKKSSVYDTLYRHGAEVVNAKMSGSSDVQDSPYFELVEAYRYFDKDVTEGFRTLIDRCELDDIKNAATGLLEAPDAVVDALEPLDLPISAIRCKSDLLVMSELYYQFVLAGCVLDVDRAFLLHSLTSYRRLKLIYAVVDAFGGHDVIDFEYYLQKENIYAELKQLYTFNEVPVAHVKRLIDSLSCFSDTLFIMYKFLLMAKYDAYRSKVKLRGCLIEASKCLHAQTISEAEYLPFEVYEGNNKPFLLAFYMHSIEIFKKKDLLKESMEVCHWAIELAMDDLLKEKLYSHQFTYGLQLGRLDECLHALSHLKNGQQFCSVMVETLTERKQPKQLYKILLMRNDDLKFEVLELLKQNTEKRLNEDLNKGKLYVDVLYSFYTCIGKHVEAAKWKYFQYMYLTHNSQKDLPSLVERCKLLLVVLNALELTEDTDKAVVLPRQFMTEDYVFVTIEHLRVEYLRLLYQLELSMKMDAREKTGYYADYTAEQLLPLLKSYDLPEKAETLSYQLKQ